MSNIQIKDGDSNVYPVQEIFDASSEVTTLHTGASPVLFISGRTAWMKVWAPPGTQDQTNLAQIPVKYKPKEAFCPFSVFYFHGEDFGRICTCMIQDQTVQFRCNSSPTGTYGVLFSATWMF